MTECPDTDTEPISTEPRFAENVDYYFDGGLLVMTARYLTRRGHCCENGCRHCPYDENSVLK